MRVRPTAAFAGLVVALLFAAAGAASPGAQTPAAPEPDGYRMSDYRAPVPTGLVGATTVSTPELRTLLDTADPILIDVLPRPRKPGNLPATALWMPKPRDNIPGSAWLANVGFGELSAEFADYFRDNLERLSGGDKSRGLVFYCLADCWMSWNAAKRAMEYGYRNVYWYPEGSDGWAAAGLPLERAEPAPMPAFLPPPS